MLPLAGRGIGESQALLPELASDFKLNLKFPYSDRTSPKVIGEDGVTVFKIRLKYISLLLVTYM